MAWWGKLVGGTLGFMVGGPIGAMLGASFGHNFDAKSQARHGGQQKRVGYSPGNQERTQAAFFAATFSVIGHIAKADGHVSKSEIALAEQLMTHMQLNAQQKEMAMSLFNQGKSPDFQLDAVLQQFKSECHRRTTLIRMFLEIQVQAAMADGRMDPSESEILQRVALTLGFKLSDLEQIINMIKSGGASEAGQQMTLEEAYNIIGADEKMTMVDIRKLYRKLRSQHHPDKLVSKGLPEEMIKLANEKTHEIQTAWKLIQKSRGAVR